MANFLTKPRVSPPDWYQVTPEERDRYRRDFGFLRPVFRNGIAREFQRRGCPPPTLTEVARIPDEDLLRIWNFGVTGLRELRAVAPYVPTPPEPPTPPQWHMGAT